jgi:hypothetical protein
VNAFGISSIRFERSRVGNVLIRGGQAAHSLPDALRGAGRFVNECARAKSARASEFLGAHSSIASPASPATDIQIGGAGDGEAASAAREGVLAVMQRTGRDRCVRCSEPIESGRLSLAATMCGACRTKW